MITEAYSRLPLHEACMPPVTPISPMHSSVEQ
jgi:hypothetical protein